MTAEEQKIKEMYNEAFEQMAEWDSEIYNHNEEILKSIGKNAKRAFARITSGCDITDKIEIVNKPLGEENYDKYGIFKKVFCDERSVGTEGDSFEGNLYAQFDTDKYLKIPYTCY